MVRAFALTKQRFAISPSFQHPRPSTSLTPNTPSNNEIPVFIITDSTVHHRTFSAERLRAFEARTLRGK